MAHVYTQNYLIDEFIKVQQDNMITYTANKNDYNKQNLNNHYRIATFNIHMWLDVLDCRAVSWRPHCSSTHRLACLST